MDDRAELERLRKVKRLRELEAKSGNVTTEINVAPPPEDTLQIFNPFGKNFDTGIELSKDTANTLAGAGKSFYDVGRRLGQFTGQVSESDIDESKRRDAPLMNTKAGMAGNVLGSAAMFAPTAFIPGANTVTGAGLVGAGMGLLQPVGTEDSTLKNVVLGGVTGAGTQYGLQKIGGVLANRFAKKAGEAASRMTQNAERDAIVKAGQEAGMVIPRSEYNPGAASNLLERWAGKASIAQGASIKNQQVLNNAARKSLGLANDAPITEEALRPIKQAAWNVYEHTKSLGKVAVNKDFDDAITGISKLSTKLNPIPAVDDMVARLKSGKSYDAGELVDALRTFRANANTRMGPMNTDPVSRTLGKAESKAADAIESLIESKLGGQVLKDFKNARVSLGKVGTIERMIDSVGDVSGKKLVRALQKGKMLDPELKVAARFAERFPRFVQSNVNPIQGGGPLDAAATALGTATSATTGNPSAMVTAMSYLLGRPMARTVALSKMLAKDPSYGVGPISKNLPGIIGNEKLQALARLLASGKALQQ